MVRTPRSAIHNIRATSFSGLGTMFNTKWVKNIFQQKSSQNPSVLNTNFEPENDLK
jgi:hypothetical protein